MFVNILNGSRRQLLTSSGLLSAIQVIHQIGAAKVAKLVKAIKVIKIHEFVSAGHATRLSYTVTNEDRIP